VFQLGIYDCCYGESGFVHGGHPSLALVVVFFKPGFGRNRMVVCNTKFGALVYCLLVLFALCFVLLCQKWKV